jgi:hypothetical protein
LGCIIEDPLKRPPLEKFVTDRNSHGRYVPKKIFEIINTFYYGTRFLSSKFKPGL